MAKIMMLWSPRTFPIIQWKQSLVCDDLCGLQVQQATGRKDKAVQKGIFDRHEIRVVDYVQQSGTQFDNFGQQSQLLSVGVEE